MKPYKVVGDIVVRHICNCVYCNNKTEPSDHVEKVVYAPGYGEAMQMVLDMFEGDEWKNGASAEAIKVPEGQVFLTDKGNGFTYSDDFTSDHIIMFKKGIVFNTEDAVMRSATNERMKRVFDSAKPIMPLKICDGNGVFAQRWICEKGIVMLHPSYTRFLVALGFEFHLCGSDNIAAIVYQGEHVGCLMGCRL